MKQEKNRQSITNMAALVLLLVFSVGILSALLGGAGIYRRLHQRGQERENNRNAVMLITNKVRQQSGTVTVETFGERDALLLWEQNSQGAYLTRIYCHDGWLRELFAPEDGTFSPEDGEKLLPMENMALELTDGLLAVTFTDAQGHTQRFVLAVGEVCP